jgi:UDP-N-acetylglucosamine 1-carboxyvinyltransferase
MEMFVVQGGTPLTGRVRVSGAKNAALPMMAASLAARGETVLESVPDLVDVRTLGDLLETLGANVQRDPDGTVHLDCRDETHCVAEYDLVRRMRASVCVLGPLLARRGNACVSLPGGCNIGHRPIDLHLKGLAALGAEIDIRNGYVMARASRLRGARIHLGGPSGSTVTGTCNVMTAATLARGTSVIESAAREPEVVALGEQLNAMGARIAGLGASCLVIDGVDELHPARTKVIPDRIEAATLLIAAAITGGEITLEAVCPDHLTAVTDLLRHMGMSIEELTTDISSPRPPVSPSPAPHGSCSSIRTSTITARIDRPLRPADVTALPYPGIPTDVQAQLTALLSVTEGDSVVRDLVFPDRMMHVSELCRLGADIRRPGGTVAVVSGVKTLTGAHVMASDLRASAALVLAALAAEGETVIRRIYHLDRGYERLEEKLNRLGATIRRVRDEGLTPAAPEELPRRRSA